MAIKTFKNFLNEGSCERINETAELGDFERKQLNLQEGEKIYCGIVKVYGWQVVYAKGRDEEEARRNMVDDNAITVWGDDFEYHSKLDGDETELLDFKEGDDPYALTHPGYDHDKKAYTESASSNQIVWDLKKAR